MNKAARQSKKIFSFILAGLLLFAVVSNSAIPVQAQLDDGSLRCQWSATYCDPYDTYASSFQRLRGGNTNVGWSSNSYAGGIHNFDVAPGETSFTFSYHMEWTTRTGSSNTGVSTGTWSIKTYYGGAYHDTLQTIPITLSGAGVTTTWVIEGTWTVTVPPGQQNIEIRLPWTISGNASIGRYDYNSYGKFYGQGVYVTPEPTPTMGSVRCQWSSTYCSPYNAYSPSFERLPSGNTNVMWVNNSYAGGIHGFDIYSGYTSFTFSYHMELVTRTRSGNVGVSTGTWSVKTYYGGAYHDTLETIPITISGNGVTTTWVMDGTWTVTVPPGQQDIEIRLPWAISGNASMGNYDYSSYGTFYGQEFNLNPTPTATFTPTSTPTDTPTPSPTNTSLPNFGGSGECWSTFSSWEVYAVSYSIDSNTIPPSLGWDTYIHAAAQTWNDVTPSHFQFVYESNSPNIVSYENLNEPSYVAMTAPHPLLGFMRITSEWLKFNSQYDWDINNEPIYEGYPSNGSTSTMNVQNIATHEFGHWLGLENINETWGACSYVTMWYKADYGDIGDITLATPDIEAANYQYP